MISKWSYDLPATVNYEDVILTIFDYFSLLRFMPLASYHFEEMKQLSATSFRFREKSQPHSFVRNLALALLDPFQPQDILSGAALSREWDETAVRELLDSMRPENGRVTVLAREHDHRVVGDNVEWSAEKWYGTEYMVTRMSESLLEGVSTIILSKGIRDFT